MKNSEYEEEKINLVNFGKFSTASTQKRLSIICGIVEEKKTFSLKNNNNANNFQETTTKGRFSFM